ncbi:MAG TPA: hypothetical protein VFJ95_05230 [Gammaproteobacteria bacterium]|nr:hypothetical protein [Gammaproteobacteria bacterium]
MSDLDDTLLHLFAGEEPSGDYEAFAAAVRRRVAARRRLANATKLGAVAALAVAAGALAVLAPGIVLYPVDLLPRALGPQAAAGASLLAAAGLAWWSRFGDA